MNTGDDLPTLVGVVTADTASDEIMGPNPIAQMTDMHSSDNRRNLCWCEDFEQVLIQLVPRVKARLITRATPPMRFTEVCVPIDSKSAFSALRSVFQDNHHPPPFCVLG